MRSILEVVPESLYEYFGPCFGDRVSKGVLVTVTKTPSRAVIKDGDLLRDGENYYCIIAAYMADEFPEYEWEHVSYGWEVEDAKEAAAKKRKSPFANTPNQSFYTWKGN